MFGVHIKAAIATAGVVFVDVFGGSTVVLSIYGFFTLLDLLAGVLCAVVYKTFDSHRLFFWFRKVFTQLFVLCMFGLLLHMFAQTSGVVLYITNWLLFMYSIVDFASVLDKLRYLGLPINPIILLFLSVVRKKVAMDISQFLQDPSVREEIERALNAGTSKVMED